jgi:hypothetical protein
LSIGDVCPKCRVGHIYPTGRRETSSKSDWTLGKHEFEKTTLVCDKCGQVVESLVARDVGHGTDTVRIIDKKRDES